MSGGNGLGTSFRSDEFGRVRSFHFGEARRVEPFRDGRDEGLEI